MIEIDKEFKDALVKNMIRNYSFILPLNYNDDPSHPHKQVIDELERQLKRHGYDPQKIKTMPDADREKFFLEFILTNAEVIVDSEGTLVRFKE